MPVIVDQNSRVRMSELGIVWDNELSVREREETLRDIFSFRSDEIHYLARKIWNELPSSVKQSLFTHVRERLSTWQNEIRNKNKINIDKKIGES